MRSPFSSSIRPCFRSTFPRAPTVVTRRDRGRTDAGRPGDEELHVAGGMKPVPGIQGEERVPPSRETARDPKWQPSTTSVGAEERESARSPDGTQAEALREARSRGQGQCYGHGQQRGAEPAPGKRLGADP